MDKLTIRDADVAGKRVFVRVDFNVPLADGKVTDDSRIRAAIPTIALLLTPARGSSSRAISGARTARSQDGLRLRPVGQRLTELIRRNVPVTGDALGVGTEDAVKRLRPGELLLLENLRFHAEEEQNDPNFAAKLAELRGRLRQRRVRDGPSGPRVDRRDREAPAGLCRVPDGARARALSDAPRVAGPPVRRDPRRRQGLRQDQGHRQPADQGGHARPRWRHGQHVPARPGQGRGQEPRRARPGGRRPAHPRDGREERASASILPVDVIVAKEVTRGTEYKTLPAEKIPASWHIVDLGKASQDLMVAALADAQTVFWNGPLGVFEIPSFAHGTKAIARMLADRGRCRRHGRRRRRRLGGRGHPAGPGRHA